MRNFKKILFLSLLIVLGAGVANAAERHWVGNGTGIGRFWDRAANWSTTQGGPGGAGVPTASDDVYVDGGGRMEINTTAFCLSFTKTQVGQLTDFRSPYNLTVGTGGFLLTAGTFDVDVSNTVFIKGDFTISGGTFLSGAGTMVFNGTSTQTITSTPDFNNVTFDNTAGFVLSTDMTIKGTMTLSNGVIETGAYTVVIPSTGIVDRTLGYVFGKLQRHVVTGPTSITYDVGCSSSYLPVNITFGNVNTAGALTVSGLPGDHPLLGSSSIHQELSVNNHWRLTNDGVIFDTYAARFNFTPGDLDAPANANAFLVERENSAVWNNTTVGARTSTSTEATGLTAFGDFAVGNSSVDLTITASASAGGSIFSSGAVSVSYGDNQAFTITPDPGYFISDINVDSVSVGPVTSYTFNNVTEDHSIVATFEVMTFPISATAGANGSVTPVGVTTLNYGDAQGYTITPNTGYFIADVFVDSVSVGAVSDYTFNSVDAAHSIHAEFSIQAFSISATSGANGSVTPAGVTAVDFGGSQPYAITPNTGYFISDVFVDSVSVGAVSSYTFNNVMANHTIGASFALTAHTISASASSGGSISPSGAVGVSNGGNMSFTITPGTGYHVDSVVVGGVNQGPVSGYTFNNITADQSIVAYFSLNQYAITAGAGSGGSISPSGVVSVAHGSTQGFVITPNTGYYIVDVYADTVSVGAVSSYSFTNILTDHSIQATFALQTFTVTALAGPNGSVSPAGASVVNFGDTLEISIIPNTGYYVTGLFIDSVSVGVSSSYAFTDITADHLLEATFSTNAPPSAPFLAAPANVDTIPVGLLGSVDFSWHPSTDIDAGDTLWYTLDITGPGVNFSMGGLTDTTVNLDLSGLLIGGDTYLWTVSVNDGQTTVSSPDTFSFSVNPGTAVGDEMGLPMVFMLGQNYPNPFNPTTSIPFDLPERSTVSLKIYNVIGAEVMEIVAGESMSAGSYRQAVDFTSLSSGAYFYRLSASGESGMMFERVMKLVVIK